MHQRRLIAVATVLAVAALGGPAYAADGAGGTATVSATVSGLAGERAVTSVLPVSLAGTGSTMSGALSVVVAETNRAGTNPWSVTAAMSGMTSGTNAIPASALSISDRAATQLLGGGTAAAPSGAGALGAAQTLFTVSNQNTAAVYTGTYTGTSTMSMTVPNGAATGVYTGTLTVTLVQ